jgi:hypothetical protein
MKAVVIASGSKGGGMGAVAAATQTEAAAQLEALTAENRRLHARLDAALSTMRHELQRMAEHGPGAVRLAVDESETGAAGPAPDPRLALLARTEVRTLAAQVAELTGALAAAQQREIALQAEHAALQHRCAVAERRLQEALDISAKHFKKIVEHTERLEATKRRAMDEAREAEQAQVAERQSLDDALKQNSLLVDQIEQQKQAAIGELMDVLARERAVHKDTAWRLTAAQEADQLTIAQLAAELERVNGELAGRQEQLRALYASTSWRVTGPLRAVGHWIGTR